MKDGKILERLVGENVKLRRKIEALQKDTQKIKVYKDMLKNIDALEKEAGEEEVEEVVEEVELAA